MEHAIGRELVYNTKVHTCVECIPMQVRLRMVVINQWSDGLSKSGGLAGQAGEEIKEGDYASLPNNERLL